MVSALRDAVPDADAPLPARDELGRRFADHRRSPMALVESLFLRRADGTVEHDEPALAAALGAALPPRVDEGRPFSIAQVTTADGIRSAAFAEIGPPDARGAAPLVGLVLATDAFGPWIRAGLEQGPLLPPSLAEGELGNAGLAAEIRRPGEPPVFRHVGDRFADDLSTARLAAEIEYGDRYQGLFDGYVLRLALDPASASDLVIGGLPRSRLPLLAVLLLLTGGVLGTAVVQLRRERELMRLRSDFVSRVSHELRTPLTQIRMFAETLLLGRTRSEDSEDEGRRSLEIIDRESRRLSHLVENILRFSRAERDGIRLAVERRELGPLVEDFVERCFPLVGDGRLEREGELAGGEPAPAPVDVDAEALQQILSNLLDNALKYGPAGGTIRIGWKVVESDDAGSRARIWLEDEGPGVPAADRERVFRSFERLERKVEREVAGTGIGLSVVRELTRLHGGRVWVEDGAAADATTAGARFVVELPLQKESDDG